VRQWLAAFRGSGATAKKKDEHVGIFQHEVSMEPLLLRNKKKRDQLSFRRTRPCGIVAAWSAWLIGTLEKGRGRSSDRFTVIAARPAGLWPIRSGWPCVQFRRHRPLICGHSLILWKLKKLFIRRPRPGGHLLQSPMTRMFPDLEFKGVMLSDAILFSDTFDKLPFFRKLLFLLVLMPCKVEYLHRKRDCARFIK